MTKEYRFPVVVTDVVRGRTSRNGNPTFDIETEQGTFRTQADAGIGYAMANYTNPRLPEGYIIDQEVVLITTRSGKVWAIEKDGRILP